MPADRPTHDSTRTQSPPADPPTGAFPLPLDTDPSPPQVEVPPQPPRVPGYAVEEVLGRGGMGVVYRAAQATLKRPAAVKVLLAGGHATAADILRLRAEAATVAALDHPNVVRVYDAGDAGGVPYLAMELCPGGSLADKLKAGPLPTAEAVAVVAAIARGVGAAHAAGIVHRDLKPGNVLFAADGTPKVADFGLARSGDSGLTATFAVMGTPAYMAPEQAEGRIREVGPAADVWAVGCILYECLTGRPPFRGETPLGTLDQVRFGRLVPPRKFNPKVPAWLEAVCLRCLSRKPGERYETAGEIVAAVERPSVPVRRPFRAGVAVVAASVTACVLALVGRQAAEGEVARPPAEVVQAQDGAELAPPPVPVRSAEATELAAFEVVDRPLQVGGIVPGIIAPPKKPEPEPDPPAVELSNGTGYAFMVIGSDDPTLDAAHLQDEQTWLSALGGLVPEANRLLIRGGKATASDASLPSWVRRTTGNHGLTALCVREELEQFVRRPGPDDTLFVVCVGIGVSERVGFGGKDFAFVTDTNKGITEDTLLWASSAGAALYECSERVKLVLWDVSRRTTHHPAAVSPALLGERPFEGIPRCSALVACADGQSNTVDDSRGSHFSHCVARLLSGRVADAFTLRGRLNVGALGQLLPGEYRRLSQSVSVTDENGREVLLDLRPEQVGTLPSNTPIIQLVE